MSAARSKEKLLDVIEIELKPFCKKKDSLGPKENTYIYHIPKNEESVEHENEQPEYGNT